MGDVPGYYYPVNTRYQSGETVEFADGSRGKVSITTKMTMHCAACGQRIAQGHAFSRHYNRRTRTPNAPFCLACFPCRRPGEWGLQKAIGEYDAEDEARMGDHP
jgi:hypothetical protein